MSANDIEIDEPEWRPIPGWEGHYEASNAGNIRSVRRVLSRAHPKSPARVQVRSYGGKVLSPKTSANGYAAVNLWRDNKGTTVDVHRLVCAAFNGAAPRGMDVNHINGCRTDNRPNNLEWVTRRENLLHAERVLGSKMVWTHQKERAAQRRKIA
jgi:hypothetical protein